MGAMTSTMPNTQNTQPRMNNAGYDSTSMTPVKTRGLAGKQAILKIVRAVVQKISFRLIAFITFYRCQDLRR